MAEIAIIRNNFIVYDTGLVRVIRSLTRKYSTIVLGWNREKKSNNHIDSLKKEIMGDKNYNFDNLDLKILKLQAPVRKPNLRAYLPLTIFFPLFWTWVLANLVANRPKVVFACDLDTVLPCYIYKKIFRAKLAFYIFDRYALTYIPQQYGILFNIVHKTEEYFSKRSDFLITVGENVLNTFTQKPSDCAIVSNYPEEIATHVSGGDKMLTIVYGGHIMRGRGLENIVSAIKVLHNVELHMYGLLIHRNLLNELTSASNVKYKGYLVNTDDYYKVIANADAMIAIYNLDNPAHSITMHNKTFETMMCGIPIITNLSPELVNKVGCGITVDYNSVEEIRVAVTRLRDDPELCKTMGKRGRNAFLEKYNWKVAEKELYRVCHKLLRDNINSMKMAI